MGQISTNLIKVREGIRQQQKVKSVVARPELLALLHKQY
jgi:hypothetical protein